MRPLDDRKQDPGQEPGLPSPAPPAPGLCGPRVPPLGRVPPHALTLGVQCGFGGGDAGTWSCSLGRSDARRLEAPTHRPPRTGFLSPEGAANSAPRPLGPPPGPASPPAHLRRPSVAPFPSRRRGRQSQGDGRGWGDGGRSTRGCGHENKPPMKRKGDGDIERPGAGSAGKRTPRRRGGAARGAAEATAVGAAGRQAGVGPAPSHGRPRPRPLAARPPTSLLSSVPSPDLTGEEPDPSSSTTYPRSQVQFCHVSEGCATRWLRPSISSPCPSSAFHPRSVRW